MSLSSFFVVQICPNCTTSMSDYFDDDIDDHLFHATSDNQEWNQDSCLRNSSRAGHTSTRKQLSMFDFVQQQLRLDTSNPHNPNSIPSYHEVNESTISKWIYPINFPIRDYQFNICRTALFKNTLVCLPTGLGKTFIAAVIMYNYYRWFRGKIIFLAPTKPLVNQQIDACYQITGITKVIDLLCRTI
jgi:superfamily II RNA helicase